MASYEILKNQPLVVDLPSDFIDQGWVVSGNVGYHSGCNNGYMDKNFDLSTATQWTFRYKIKEYTNGSINIVVGANTGVSRTSIGVYEETFNVTGNNALVRFFSSGTNAVEVLQIFPEERYVGGRTLVFNEHFDKWAGDRSYVPEMMSKFLNSFFLFQNGELWENNVNLTRNNFMGVQYTSKIVFYCNVNPSMVKTFFSMRQKSNKVWTMPEGFIYPREGKANGQITRLKKGRFNRLQGDFFADFLRDINDPRFDNEASALLRGAEMQGNLMKITLECDETGEVRLESVDISVSKSDYTY